MNTDGLATYHFSVLRVVPHPYLGSSTNVGVIVHVRTAEFLAMRAITDPAALKTIVPEVDVELLARYLECLDAIAKGDPSAGPVALVPTSERFHWMTAPRSDVIQASPVHEGLSDDPAKVVTELFETLVGPRRG
jgi:hypothetical protein